MLLSVALQSKKSVHFISTVTLAALWKNAVNGQMFIMMEKVLKRFKGGAALFQSKDDP